MDTDVLIVLLEGRSIGRVERRGQSRLVLTYDESYLADNHATPLSVSMPSVVAEHPDRAVTPWLWGLLPDNDAVLRRWAREFEVSVASPFSLLGTAIGHDCAGAVQFARPEELDELVSRPGDISWIDEAAVARRLRVLRADATAWLGPDFGGQFSLAGVQAKTALHYRAGRWGVPSGPMPTTHIVKPAVPGFESQELNEHLCLAAARRLGLAAARTTLATFDDELAIVVERFDRITDDSGTVVRVHQEDLCQALGVRPDRKYQSEGGPSPRDIAELLRTVIPGRQATEAVHRFADALIFNWLIAGTDAHAKNYALLLSGPDLRLAPLYDITSYLPYDDSDGHNVRLAMKVGGEYRLVATDRPGVWRHTARELGLDRDDVTARAAELATRVTDAFAGAAAEPAVRNVGSPLPARLVDLVASRAGRCHRLVTSAVAD